MPARKTIVTAQLVPESKRLDVADRHFGIRFPLQFEPMVYRFAEQLAESYTGGYWQFYTLSNGGFYMAPDSEESFSVVADNGYSGKFSADALGITACLYAYSNLSFSEDNFGRRCAKNYGRLLNFALKHPEASAIRAAID
ncbi:antirestriction protein [Propionivibrio sp.]|uniref:antirestriction protein n=1 Tax=Propionivibrio sp. TaxID=2212460 RepID=UPI0039E2D226